VRLSKLWSRLVVNAQPVNGRLQENRRNDSCAATSNDSEVVCRKESSQGREGDDGFGQVLCGFTEVQALQ
jgi:hypothetical protein